jgi:Ser/Thr protein kinase RdoA (MazF antagonist)
MDTQDSRPFAGLTPDCVLSAVDSLGLCCDGRLLALNSYENRVYQVGIEDSLPLVAKFYRPGRWSNAAILEEHAFISQLAEHELPTVPALVLAGGSLHEFNGFRFALFPRQGGRAPELNDSEMLERMGRLLGRIHAVGALQTYHERPTLDRVSFGEEPLEYLLSANWLPTHQREDYREAALKALEQVQSCYERAGTVNTLRLHGDCYPGNILWTDDGPHFVDFDDSRSGPAIQDLWMLLSGGREERALQLADLLAGYEDFYEFNPRELHLLEALRTLRLLHYTAWLARRFDDPAFPLAFPWFNTPHYWQERIFELREQTILMQEPPLFGVQG